MNPLRILGRIVGACLLGTTAGIHLYLYHAQDYSEIPKIGTLFLICGISAPILGLAVLATPGQWLRLVALAGAGLELGTLAGLIVTTKHGLFGFVESTQATLYWPSVWVEIAGGVILLAIAAIGWTGRGLLGLPTFGKQATASSH